MKRHVPALALVLCLAAAARAEEAARGPHSGWRVTLSPLAGADRNRMEMHTPAGRETRTDWGLEYGLYAMASHPNWVVNNFLFFANVNRSDVWGNLFFANYYSAAGAPVAWNAGAGYLYHGIDTERGEIRVNAPMVKAGPYFRVSALRLTLNPYVGYVWERVDTPRGDADNDSPLYGVTLGWRWRMLHAGVNYYYQDSRSPRKGCHVIRARMTAMRNMRWGLHGRVDYMEHQTTDDLSFLVGPIIVF